MKNRKSYVNLVIEIKGNLVDGKDFFNQLEKLNSVMDVDFTESGEIPDYIVFDRTNKNLYYTIEELLTVFVNNKKSNVNELNFRFNDEIFVDGYDGIREIDIESIYEYVVSINDNSRILLENMIKELNETKLEYVELMKEGKPLTDYTDTHIKRLGIVEKTMMDIKDNRIALMHYSLDTIFYTIENNLKEKDEDILNDTIGYFKSLSIDYVIDRVDNDSQEIYDCVRNEYYEMKMLSLKI